MKYLALSITLLVCPLAARASNILFTYSSTSQFVSTTLTNPYSGDTFPVSGTYEVNNSTYNGIASDFNTLLLTNTPDFLLLDSGGTQTMTEIDRLVMGNGSDVVNLASLAFPIGNTLIYGGAGNQLIWANAGNDEIHVGTGSALIDGGPGTDTTVYAGTLASFTLAQTGPGRVSIDANNNSIQTDLSGVEFAQFSDQTVDLSNLPEPTAALCAAGITVELVLSRSRRR